MDPLLPTDPSRLGNLVLLGRIGSGGMGRVYLGRTPGGRLVAVKLVHEPLARDPGFRARFRREVDAARRVNGAFTAPVVTAQAEAERPWIATSYIAGPSLSQLVAAAGPLPTDAVRSLGAGLAEALVAIHRAGVVHRDLKPSNVLMAEDGPRVIDFGIARAIDEPGITATRQILGTPGFIAPEQIRGDEPGPPGDVFALGAVLCFAATGQGPFGTAPTPALLYRVLSAEPDLSAVLDPELRETITVCLTKEPTGRPTPAEVLSRCAPTAGTALAPALPAVTAPAVTVPAAAVPAEPTIGRRGRARGIRSGALVAVLVLGLAVLTTGLGWGPGIGRWTGRSATGDANSGFPRNLTLRIGVEHLVTTYASSTAASALGRRADLVVLNQVLRGFGRLDPTGEVQPDDEFGRVEKISDQPLTVRYSIDPRAVWSDGAPVTCDDAVLTWLANAQVTGASGFRTIDPGGYERQDRPACVPGARDFTVSYRTPFTDWRSRYGWTSLLPAHVVEQRSGLTRPLAELAATPSAAELRPAIAFYNTGWSLSEPEFDPSRFPSSGPYTISALVPGTSVTLTANPRWWGTPPRIRTLVFTALAPAQQIRALAAGDLDVADVQQPLRSQAATLTALTLLGDEVAVHSGADTSATFLDVNFRSALADLRLRQALAACLPRRQILDRLVRPAQPEAQILGTRVIPALSPQYPTVAARSGHQDYLEVDLARTRSLLAEVGRSSLTVRVGWRRDAGAAEYRSAELIGLMNGSCAPAGLTVVDVGTADFSPMQADPADWDVALTTHADELPVAGALARYHSPGPGSGTANAGGYRNPAVDALLDRLDRTGDAPQRVALLEQVEVALWSDLPSLPLFATPRLVATGRGVTNVAVNGTEQGLTWNATRWDKP